MCHNPDTSQQRALYAQGSLCQSNVLFVYHASCVTIPIPHNRELFTHRVLCAKVTFSLCMYHASCVTISIRHNRALYAQGSLYHSNVLFVYHASCVTIPIRHSRALYAQGSLFHSNVLFVYHASCVTIPKRHSSELFMHRALCFTVTFSLCTMPLVSQSRYVTIESSLCTGFFVAQ